jgi:nitroreductase
MADAATAREIDDAERIADEHGTKRSIVPIPPGAPWNAVEEAIFRRRSIRRYRKAQVPEHLVRRVLEAGRYAPSQGNCQPWKFVVVRDAALIAQMETFCVARCRALSNRIDYARLEKGTLAYAGTRLLAKAFAWMQPNMMHPVPVAAMGAIADGRFMVFHRAPTVILLLMDKRGIGTPEIDIGICGQNIVLAAQSFGLGTCWIGFSKFLNEGAEWRERFGAEEPWEIVEAITLGWPVGDPTRPVARETHEIAWFEHGRKDVRF